MNSDTHLSGGFGGEVAAVIAENAFESLRAPIKRVCSLDMPVPAGALVRASIPSEERIEAAVRAVLEA